MRTSEFARCIEIWCGVPVVSVEQNTSARTGCMQAALESARRVVEISA